MNKVVLRFYCIVPMFDRIIRLSPRKSEKNVLSSRLQNNRLFFSKSVKKSVKRGVRVLSAKLAKLASLPHTPVRRVRREKKKPSISIASP